MSHNHINSIIISMLQQTEIPHLRFKPMFHIVHAHYHSIILLLNNNTLIFIHIQLFIQIKANKAVQSLLLNCQHSDYNVFRNCHLSIQILEEPNSYNYCLILKQQNFLSLGNLIKYVTLCLVFKILHNAAPPPLQTFTIQRSNNNRVTRGSARGDFVPMRKSAFGKAAFSVKATQDWNSIPLFFLPVGIVKIQLKLHIPMRISHFLKQL